MCPISSLYSHTSCWNCWHWFKVVILDFVRLTWSLSYWRTNMDLNPLKGSILGASLVSFPFTVKILIIWLWLKLYKRVPATIFYQFCSVFKEHPGIPIIEKSLLCLFIYLFEGPMCTSSVECCSLNYPNYPIKVPLQFEDSSKVFPSQKQNKQINMTWLCSWNL
jgi:hypothetical protein